jgi:hypothetical protein
LACCTASIAKARIALAICWVFAMSGDSGGVVRENHDFSEPDARSPSRCRSFQKLIVFTDNCLVPRKR